MARQYAELGHEVFLTNHSQAAVLLLGGASETILVNLVDAMNSRLGTPFTKIKDRTAKKRLERLKNSITTHEKAVGVQNPIRT